MVPVREPLFPLGSRKIRKKVPLQLRIDYHILVVCFRIYDLWINKSMVEIANAGTLRELTLRVRTLTSTLVKNAFAVVVISFQNYVIHYH